MVPFLILVGSTLLLRLGGVLGVRALESWPTAFRFGLACMFLFTGATHFSSMRHDYAAMIPPPFSGSLGLVYFTGALQIAGAIGLIIPRTSRAAAICLAVLLVVLFSANVNAAVQTVPFRGRAPTPLWLRGPVQALFLLTLWWSAIRPRSSEDPLGDLPAKKG